MTLIIFWVGFTIAVAIYADRKGRNPAAWFLASLVISPLLAFILIAASGEGGGAKGMRKCPACAEMVRGEAVKCKHCGSALTAVPQPLGPISVTELNKSLKR